MPLLGTRFSRKIQFSVIFISFFVCLTNQGACEEPDAALLLPEPVAPNTSQDESLSALTPLTPEPLDFGSDVIDALAASPLGPVTDPNVDSMQTLDEPEMEAVEVPKEAENKIWRIRPYIKTGITYDDNIFITNTNRTADIIYNTDGGFTFELGDYRDLHNNYLLLEYLASGFFFSNHPAQNSLDQSYSLLAQYRIDYRYSW